MLVLFAAAALQPNIIYLRFTDTGIVSIYTELSKASKYLNIDAFNILKLQPKIHPTNQAILKINQPFTYSI